MSEVAKGIQSFACGQLVSLFSMASLVTAKYLVLRDVSTPFFLNCCFYLFLSITCLGYGWRKQGKLQQQQQPRNHFQPVTPPGSPVLTPVNMGKPPKVDAEDDTRAEPRWWVYPLIAFFDVQANCAAVRSLAFADYVSVGLILNLTIPFVSLLSCIMRGRKYSWRHVVGCGIASAGGAVLFLGSYYRDQERGTSQQTYGCFLALLAALMYGACNVTNQLCLNVKDVDQIIESVGLIGSWGSVIAMVQMILFERVQVTAIAWTGDVSLCFAAYILAMFAFYLLVSLLPQVSSSPIYNLSILASNLYLAFASYYLFVENPHDYFSLALALVLVGLTMRCIEHSRAQSHAKPEASHVSFESMHTPSDTKSIAIKIEQAAL